MRKTCRDMCVGVGVRGRSGSEEGGRGQNGRPGDTLYAKGHAPAGRESTAPWSRMRFQCFPSPPSQDTHGARAFFPSPGAASQWLTEGLQTVLCARFT